MYVVTAQVDRLPSESQNPHPPLTMALIIFLSSLGTLTFPKLPPSLLLTLSSWYSHLQLTSPSVSVYLNY